MFSCSPLKLTVICSLLKISTSMIQPLAITEQNIKCRLECKYLYYLLLSSTCHHAFLRIGSSDYFRFGLIFIQKNQTEFKKPKPV